MTKTTSGSNEKARAHAEHVLAIQETMSKRRPGLVLQSVIYVAAGLNHFVHTAFYVGLMPRHYADPRLLVQISGVVEIAGGLGLLIPKTRRWAACGLILLLIVFLDVHQDMLRHADRFPGVPRWVLWARIPLQFALMAWAGAYARKSGAGAGGSE